MPCLLLGAYPEGLSRKRRGGLLLLQQISPRPLQGRGLHRLQQQECSHTGTDGKTCLDHPDQARAQAHRFRRDGLFRRTGDRRNRRRGTCPRYGIIYLSGFSQNPWPNRRRVQIQYGGRLRVEAPSTLESLRRVPGYSRRGLRLGVRVRLVWT